MALQPNQLPALLTAIDQALAAEADTIAELDQAIGDGDHLDNLQRGLKALQAEAPNWRDLTWPSAWREIGMVIMRSVGGASGSLYASLFIAMSKATDADELDLPILAHAFEQGVAAVKQRGRTEPGEKTMVDVLAPVAQALSDGAAAHTAWPVLADQLLQIAEQGVEATRDMLATKGRASFLGERSLGHIDAGAKTSALMLTTLMQFDASQA
ncbi:MAG: dihydroxyacetone kinase subunit DhaL [Methylococcales bacterium]|nr:dihydroxyacetone kinase subunit DhaL [Methylococcales bacterium]